MTTPHNSILLVLLASLIGSLAMVLLKLGADRHRDKRAPSQWLMPIGGGIALFLASSVLYVLGIRNGSLTVLYPMVSLGYVWALFWARWFFNEPFNRSKIVGLSLVVLGVFFVGMGNS
ncbi:MAG: EamA family transporter [Acidobacteria bacterium]|nr:EamA family transporter [Acidobacteriota bacterium]